MERILLFLPSILTIGGIAFVALLYLKLMIRKLGDDLESIDWIEKNKLKVCLLINSPNAYIFAPTWEELAFRAPLIIIFSELSQSAWCGILISSVLFSLLHWFGSKVTFLEILNAREENENESDNLEDESERLSQKMKKEIRSRKTLHILFTFPIGIMLGYIGIEYQSIWMCVGFHSLWNLIMPIVMLLVMILVAIISVTFSSLWRKVCHR